MYLSKQLLDDIVQDDPELAHKPLTARAAIQTSQSNDSHWLIYTIVGASLLILLIALVILYDLWSRYREIREQHISDGGPPTTPGHTCGYFFSIKVDEASQNFEAKRSVVRLELLDHQNQYLTSIAIPCFLFKLKSPGQKTNDSIGKMFNNYPNPIEPSNKSTTNLQQVWSSTPKSNLITFYLVRRHPLIRLSSVRISHDCYTQGSYISFKYVTIRDEATFQCVKAELVGQTIKAPHPCPPSGYQVFPFEVMENYKPADDRKSCPQHIWTCIRHGCCCK